MDRRKLLKGVSLGGMALAARPGIASVATQADSIIDSHIHLISEDETRYPRAVKGKTGGGGARQDGVRMTPTVPRVLRWMQENGVDHAVAVQKKSVYEFDNRYTIEASNVLPERFRAVLVLDAEQPTTPGVLSNLAKQHNVVGIRLTGNRAGDGSMPWLDSPAAQRVWAIASELKLAVDLMAMPPAFHAAPPEHYTALARRFPGCSLVLNHIAWPTVEAGLAQALPDGLLRMRDLANVYFKLTTINLDLAEQAKVPTEAFVRLLADKLGTERLMWGSDMGNSAGSYAEMVERARLAATSLNDAERRQLLAATAARVYRI